MLNRASQFKPFSALKGFDEVLKMVEDVALNKDILNDNLNKLKAGDYVKIKYFSNLNFLEIVGTIKKVDRNLKKIFLLNSKIDMKDIISIEFILR